MKKKKIVFSFGRFNPPTTGHLLLASKVKQEAMRRGADHIIFGSSSQDRKKNPLSPRDKLRFMKKVLKGFNVMVDGSIASPFHALDHINKQGYTDVVFVVGGDRVPEFRKQMKKYVGPGKMYKFQNFEVISAGERDPDADDVTGMSASKMRGAAAEGNLDAFQLGIPSGVSTHDVQMLFKKIQKGMGVKPFVAESWFNLDEFNEFLSEQNLKDFDLGGKGIDIPAVNNAVWGTEGLKKKKKKKKKVNIEKIFEISMQSRRKMARNAKRTAKRRARKRKIKEKRKKSEGAIKKKAQKAAIAKVRQKLIKGVNWNDLSFSQRSKIEDKLKTKKKAIARLSKRLLPSARASEKERLKRVRAKMTTNDPAKAIEKFEDINIDFENEIILEYSRSDITQQRQIAKDREKKAKEKEANEKETSRTATTSNPWDDVLIVSTDDGKKELIVKSAYKPDKHTLEMGSIGNENKGKVNKAEASKLELDPDFHRTKTYTELVGWEEEQSKKQRKAADEKEAQRSAKSDDRGRGNKSGDIEQDNPLRGTAQDPKVVAASNAASIASADADEAEAKVRTARAKDELAQLKPQEGDGSVASPEEIQKKRAKMAEQKLKNGAKDKTDFKAVDIEAGVAVEFNRMQGHPDEIGNVSSDNMEMLDNSATLITSGVEKYGIVEESAAARVVRDSINPLIEELDPNGELQWHMEHSGSSMKGLKPSKHWLDNDATNATPKSDLVLVGINEKGERIERGISVKAGPSQLLSPTPEEANAIITGVFGKMISHCEGKSTEECKSLLQSETGTKENIDKLVKLIMDHNKMRFQTGKGVGPMGWFTPGGRYTRAEGKPDYWDVYGPGSKCKKNKLGNVNPDCATSWESLEGEEPKAEHWKGTDAGYDQNVIDAIHDSAEYREELNASMNEILNESKEFTLGLIHEAMTGCIKFCGCCDADCGCTSAVPTHYLTMSPDGSNSAIREIDEQLLMDVAKETLFNFQLKSSGRKEMREGRKQATGVYPSYIALRSQKKPKSKKPYASINDGVQPFLKYSNIFIKEDMDIKDAKRAFENDLKNPGDIEEREKEFKSVKGDPARLLNALNLKIDNVDTNEVPWQDIGMMKPSNKSNIVRIDGKMKRIPIMTFKEKDDVNEEFQSIIEKAPAGWMKKQGHKSRKSITDSYEFKDSSTHGMGTFATKDINENDTVGLYYLNLLNENKNAPQFQRTDFCRFTNHSQHIPNVALIKESDGNFYTYATREIQEGEELLVDYFDVYEQIMPSLGSYGEVIPEVLRWTEGYENMEIPPDSFGDLRDELQYFSEINEAVDVVTGVEENISITGHNKKGHVIGGFYVHGGKNDPEIARKIKSIKKNFGRNLHKIEVKKHGQNIQEPEFVTDSVASDMKDKIKDKIDDFKFYTSSSQTKIRKKEKERKKRVRKSNKKIGIIPEGAGDASASASETDANRAAYLKQYGAKPEQRKRRSARTNARNKMIRSGRASVGDGKDLDHRDGNPLNNSSKNLRMVNRSFNRGRDNNKWRKTNEEHGAGEIGTEKLLKRYIKDTPFMKIIKDKNGK